MFKKDTPLTAKLPLFFVIGELGTWLLTRYFLGTPDVYGYPGPFAEGVFLMGVVLLILLSLAGLALIVYELLVALKTREHYWYLYIVGLIIFLPWISVLAYRPAVHHCGCVVPPIKEAAPAPARE